MERKKHESCIRISGKKSFSGRSDFPVKFSFILMKYWWVLVGILMVMGDWSRALMTPLLIGIFLRLNLAPVLPSLSPLSIWTRAKTSWTCSNCRIAFAPMVSTSIRFALTSSILSDRSSKHTPRKSPRDSPKETTTFFASCQGLFSNFIVSLGMLVIQSWSSSFIRSLLSCHLVSFQISHIHSRNNEVVSREEKWKKCLKVELPQITFTRGDRHGWNPYQSREYDSIWLWRVHKLVIELHSTPRSYSNPTKSWREWCSPQESNLFIVLPILWLCEPC